MRTGVFVEAAVVGGSLLAVGATLKSIYRAVGWDTDATPTAPAQQVPWPIWLGVTSSLTYFALEGAGVNQWIADRHEAASTGVQPV